jgi:hypothetical protein
MVCFQPIVDTNSVKNTIVLASPKGAPNKLQVLFKDQVGTLNMVRLADEDEEQRTGKVISFHYSLSTVQLFY